MSQPTNWANGGQVTPAYLNQLDADTNTNTNMVFNVVHFGAVGDFTTDNTTAFQNALNAAAASGPGPGGDPTNYGPTGTVLVPHGMYITGPLTIPHGVTICGMGIRSSKLLLKAGSTAPLLSNAAHTHFIGIRDIMLDGGAVSSSNTGAHGIYLSNTWTANSTDEYNDAWHYLTNVHVQSFPGSGFVQIGNGACKGTHLSAFNNRGHGFDVQVDSTWVNCDSGANGYDGFIIRTASNRLIGCKAYYSGYFGVLTGIETDGQGYGFHFVNGGYNDNTLIGCNAQDNSRAGFYCNQGGRIMMIGCDADSNNTACVAPPVLSATPSATGGTIAAGTYYLKLTATNTNGETLPSNEVTVTTTGTTSSIGCSWPQPHGALGPNGYKLYLGTAPGAENVLVSTIGSGSTLTATVTSTTGTTASPPTTNNTANLGHANVELLGVEHCGWIGGYSWDRGWSTSHPVAPYRIQDFSSGGFNRLEGFIDETTLMQQNTALTSDSVYYQSHIAISGNVDNRTVFPGTVTPGPGGVLKRVFTVATTATPTFSTDLYDCVNITTLVSAITSFTSGVTGTPTDFQKLMIRIKDGGSSQSITWGTLWQANGLTTLPSATTAGKTIQLGFEYNAAAAKWILIASDLTGY